MNAALRHLARARLHGEAMAPLPPDLRPADENAAYALQARLHEHYRGHGLGPVAGYKIGCTSAVMQRYLGIPNPCAGGILEPGVRTDHGAFAHGDFLRVGVECELAVRIGRDLPGGGVRFDAAGVAPAIESFMCAIEVVDDRWLDYRGVDTPSLIADDFFAAGAVLGPPCARWRDLRLPELTARMAVNGERVGEGRGGDILGDPLEALVWLANARSRCAPPDAPALAAGHLVLLGSMVKTCWLSRGDEVEIEVDGLGRASASFR